MKVCVIQPYYSFDECDTEKCFDEMLKLLDECDESLDLIVLPEYSDIPAAQGSKESFHNSIKAHNDIILTRAKETARRLHSIVFVNAADESETGYRNTTHVIDREGNVVGKYFKAHPAPSEVKTEAEGGNELDVGYSYEFYEPCVIELEGIRFGFMTCYDFYFYESFAPLARANVDVIIGCSHQRTDTHEALSIINRFLCYNTNAYLIRSSVSLGEESPICGCSTVIAPDGRVIVDMKSKVGLGICEIDPHAKYYKAAGFRGKLKSHYEYIEEGRRPWFYRNGGAGVVPFDKYMTYPRLCAHRGLCNSAPENSLPALGAAVSLGAREIEFDVYSTKDGVIVATHDSTLERTSDGEGLVTNHTYEQLLALDFGSKYSESYKGLKIATLEEILIRLGSHVVMNIHVKAYPDKPYSDEAMKSIIALIRKYDCEKHVYLMIGHTHVIKQFKEYAPDIRICVGKGHEDPYAMVDRAIELGCEKVQLWKTDFTEEMVKKAHDHGIRCNVFYADEPELAKKYLEMGVDTILTNNYLALTSALGIK